MEPTTRHVPVLAAGVTLAVLGVAAVLDLGVFNPRTPSGRLLLAEAVLVAVAAWRVRSDAPARPGRAAAWALLAAVPSAGLTVLVSGTVLQRTPGAVASLGLLVTLTVLCRYLPGRWLPAALPVAVALAALPLRMPDRVLDGLPGDAAGPVAVPVCAALAAGFLLRTGDLRRHAAQRAARRAERLWLAHDLHDDVAHHVTGIVVAAQAGAQIATADPAQARALFERIEASAQDGLAATGRMVRLLRDTGPAGPVVVPTLDDVRDLVDRFAVTDRPATLHVGPSVRPESWSGTHWAVVRRIVQEGLTNVRKHSRATSTGVTIDDDRSALVVSVRDAGARARRRPFRFPTGGAGLAGLSEQLDVLGGELSYGPDGSGGWLVTARIPAARP